MTFKPGVKILAKAYSHKSYFNLCLNHTSINFLCNKNIVSIHMNIYMPLSSKVNYISMRARPRMLTTNQNHAMSSVRGPHVKMAASLRRVRNQRKTVLIHGANGTALIRFATLWYFRSLLCM